MSITQFIVRPKDIFFAALVDLSRGTPINFSEQSFTFTVPVSAKHQFTLKDLNLEDEIFMYGVLIGHHAADDYHKTNCYQLDVSSFRIKKSWISNNPTVQREN